jgi:excisionase family DNA binding protein
MSKYMNLREIAAELGMPLRTVYYLNQKGLGPKCHKVGRTFLVFRDDFDAWMDQQKQP